MSSPDKFRVVGKDRYGEEFDTEEDEEETAHHIAERINRRGGEVDVFRLVYSPSKALWLQTDHLTKYKN